MSNHRHPEAELELTRDHPAQAATAVATIARPDPRRRLLDSMIDTVALRGYDRATVSRVLCIADLQEAVFTEHFRDKHDCFMQAVDNLIGSIECAALEIFQQDIPWPARVRSGLESLLDALAREPDGARVVLVEMFGAGPAACERHRRALEMFASLLEEGLSYCHSTAHLPPQTSEAIVGGIASILHRRVLQGETAELPLLHSDLTYFTLLPYLDHEPALAVAGLREP
jgi:AcrR family transcriptional regulator